MDKASEVAEKAKQAAGSGGADEKIDAASDKVNEATGDRHAEHVDKAADKAKERLGNLGE